MNGLVIFSQFPSDIRYTLWLYEEFKEKRPIAIYVVNVYNSYKFFKDLRLSKCTVEFIPYKYNLRTPIGIMREKIRLLRYYRKHFRKLDSCEIYFFSYYFDYLTFYFIKKLSGSNKILLFDFFDVKRQRAKGIGFIDYMKLIALYFLTGIPFFYTKQVEMNIITFPYEKYNVKKVHKDLDFNSIRRYLYRLNTDKKRNVLLFESNGINDEYFMEYRETLIRILSDILTHNYDIFIKPHPRKGHSKFLNDLNVRFVEDYIPAELIDVENISFIIGIESTSTTYIAENKEIPVYSLIDLFDFKNNEVKQYYKDYLKKVSEGKLIFIKKYADFLEILNKM